MISSAAARSKVSHVARYLMSRSKPPSKDESKVNARWKAGYGRTKDAVQTARPRLQLVCWTSPVADIPSLAVHASASRMVRSKHQPRARRPFPLVCLSVYILPQRASAIVRRSLTRPLVGSEPAVSLRRQRRFLMRAVPPPTPCHRRRPTCAHAY